MRHRTGVEKAGMDAKAVLRVLKNRRCLSVAPWKLVDAKENLRRSESSASCRIKTFHIPTIKPQLLAIGLCERSKVAA